MRWTQPLDEILGSRARLCTLRCLWLASEPLSAREIARRAALSHTGVQAALRHLSAQDVVWPASDPTGTRWRLNPGHELITRGIVPLFESERALETHLVAEIFERVSDVISVTLFGSAARGNDSASSDLDVLVVVLDTSDSDATFVTLAELDSRRRFGKDLGPVVMTESEARRRHRRGDRLLAAVVEDGRLLAGSPLVDIVWREPRAGHTTNRSRGRPPLSSKGGAVSSGGTRGARPR